ncbi:carbon-nitrogen hydrolase family protein [Marinobacteraceae bacterium S3BR75-40.1]
MSQRCTVGLVQMVSSRHLEDNLAVASRLIADAARAGAGLVVLPENFAVFHTSIMREAGEQETTTHGPIRRFLAETAQREGVWIVAGSLPLVTRPDGSPVPEPRVRASCLVVNSEGEEVARYDKIHLFDAEVGDDQGRYRESDTFEPGDAVVCVDTPAGRLGLSICYDLRFPELYRRLVEEGAEWITVPSAFTYRTGEAHWEPLLRARAIEDQVWICAPNQGGQHTEKRRTWGHSMAIDPWGTIVAQGDEGEQLILAEIDPERVRKVREAMPSLVNRRLS